MRPFTAMVEAILRFGGFYALLGITNGFGEISLPHRCDSIQALVWTKERKHASDSAELLLCSATVLAAPDFIRPFKIEVDARATREGGVLLNDGMEDSHSYIWVKFKHHQIPYSMI